MRTLHGAGGATAERPADVPAGPGVTDAGGKGLLRWPDLHFDRERVAALGAPAQCWTRGGELWEYEAGAFFVTRPYDHRGKRRVDDESLVPASGWSHSPECDCAACRVACC